MRHAASPLFKRQRHTMIIDKLTTKTMLYMATGLLMMFIGIATLQYFQSNQYKKYIHQLETIINNTDTTYTTQHDTVYKDTTIVFYKPVTKYKTIIRTDTLYKDTIPFMTQLNDRVYQSTNITPEGDTISYSAHITGYDINNQDYPRLDSIKLHTSHRVINTTTTVTIEKLIPQKQTRWTITPGIGTGYGLTTKNFDIYAGISVGYRLW